MTRSIRDQQHEEPTLPGLEEDPKDRVRQVLKVQERDFRMAFVERRGTGKKPVKGKETSPWR